MTLLSKFKISNYNELSINESRANLIITGFYSPIREMTSDDIALKVSAVIALCAKLYCGMKEQGTIVETIQECTRLVYKKFGSMGIHEIREAFLMASANEFENVSMTAYYGTFTVSMLGDILSAYSKYRNRVISKFIDLKNQHEEQKRIEEEREIKNKAALEKTIEEIKNAIEMAKNGESYWEHWEKIPVRYGEIAVKAGLISPSKELKTEIIREATQIEMKNARQNLINSRDPILSKKYKSEIDSIIAAAEKNKYTTEAARIYAKIILWHFVKPF
jgi:hypothetical protein